MLTETEELSLIVMILSDDPQSDLCKRALDLNNQIRNAKAKEKAYKTKSDTRKTKKARP